MKCSGYGFLRPLMQQMIPCDWGTLCYVRRAWWNQKPSEMRGQYRSVISGEYWVVSKESTKKNYNWSTILPGYCFEFVIGSSWCILKLFLCNSAWLKAHRQVLNEVAKRCWSRWLAVLVLGSSRDRYGSGSLAWCRAVTLENRNFERLPRNKPRSTGDGTVFISTLLSQKRVLSRSIFISLKCFCFTRVSYCSIAAFDCLRNANAVLSLRISFAVWCNGL